MPIELWLVQLPLAVGMIIFSVAIIDQTFCHLFFGEELPKSEEEVLAESAPIDLSQTNSLNKGA